MSFFFHQHKNFRALLGSQHNWEEDTEIDNISPAAHSGIACPLSMPTAPPPQSVYLLELTNWHVVTMNWHIKGSKSPQFTLGLFLSYACTEGLHKWTMASTHLCGLIHSNFTALNPSALPGHPTAPPQPLIFLLSLHFPECSVVGSIQCIVFSDWLFFFLNLVIHI